MAKDIMERKLSEFGDMTLEEFIELIRNEFSKMIPEDCMQECNIKAEVTSMLKELGIPANIKGYGYLRDAIIYALQEPKALHGIVSVLYAEVARKNNTTPSKTERAIRIAIQIAWERGNIDRIHEIFGYTIDINRSRPTNSEFIAMLVDSLKMKYKLG